MYRGERALLARVSWKSFDGEGELKLSFSEWMGWIRRKRLSKWKEQKEKYAQERVTPVGALDERGGTVPASGAHNLVEGRQNNAHEQRSC